MLSYKRSVRVGELIQQEISKIILEMKDSMLGFVTITGVDLTDDLKLARVYYSVFGDEESKKTTCDKLKDLTPSIRYCLGQRIQLRYLPVLEFRPDETPEKASRVFDLLKQIEREKTDQPKSVKPACPRRRKTHSIQKRKRK